MTTLMYYGRVNLVKGGFPLDVQVQATSPSAASNIIRGQFGSSFKSFNKQMASK